MTLQLGDIAPDFEADTTRRPHPLPRVARQFLGRAVLAPEGLHPGLHHRARLHGEDQAGIRQARRQDHRPQRRSGRPPREVGGRHQGDARRRAELSDDRRPDAGDLEALRHAAGEHDRHVAGPHAGRQPDGAQRVRHRPGQEDQAHPGLSDDHGPQFRRGAARHRFAAADRQASGGDPGRTGSRART